MTRTMTEKSAKIGQISSPSTTFCITRSLWIAIVRTSCSEIQSSERTCHLANRKKEQPFQAQYHPSPGRRYLVAESVTSAAYQIKLLKVKSTHSKVNDRNRPEKQKRSVIENDTQASMLNAPSSELPNHRKQQSARLR